MKKNGRLDNIIKLIPNDTEILADIGCDHGKIIVSAILTGKAKKGFAVDISKNSLNKAKKLAETVGIYQNIEFICGDGFNNINQNLSVSLDSLGALLNGYRNSHYDINLFGNGIKLFKHSLKSNNVILADFKSRINEHIRYIIV